MITSRYGALLIFDEVMTGFRVAYGGAQSLYGVAPDVTCLGKVIGGGLPVAAYAGPARIMEMVAPAGQMYQAGTLSGNPLAMAAGIATLRELAAPGVYDRLEKAAAALATGFRDAAKEAGIALQSASAGSMWGFFFNLDDVTDYASARRSDTARFARFFHEMLERGIYLAPSQFEAAFVSTAHSPEVIEETLESARTSFRAL
jgi:glutamate-1-semialdehyde 2,1-aminomutase